MRSKREPAFELGFGVVGEKPVREIDRPRKTSARDLPERLVNRRVGPFATARVVEPAVDDEAELG